MKELSIEQKAWAYDKALNRARKLYNEEETSADIEIACEIIFPELKKSEDEKIRKAIVKFFELQDDNTTYSFIPKKNILAWLEKQGEQKTYSWKPTEEQFEALDYAYNSCPDTERGNYYEGVLETLIEDLHRLEKQGETFTKKDVDDAYLKGVSDTKNEIEKQYEANYQIRKDIATFIFNYRGDLKNRAKWMDYLGIKAYFVQEQDKQNPQPTLTPKSAIEAAKEEKVDNQNCVKPAEPKFHEGDWIVKKGTIYRIDKISGVYITLSTIDGTALVYHKSVLCSERIHLWAIEDAKDGDVLKEDSCTFIIERMKPDKTAIIHCCLFDDGDFELGSTLSFDVDSTYPATKEQRDLLFQKIKEAGYEWDSEKKELKKIKDEPENYKKQVMSEITDLVKDYIKQKPTWSEEDDKISEDIIRVFKGEISFTSEKENKKYIDWLKSLKEKIGG